VNFRADGADVIGQIVDMTIVDALPNSLRGALA
jgi:hypothetical protein